MDEYFSLEELRYRVMSILEHAAQFLNSDVIVLADQELQMVFDSWYIFVPDVVENHLLSHVIPAQLSGKLTSPQRDFIPSVRKETRSTRSNPS